MQNGNEGRRQIWERSAKRKAQECWPDITLGDKKKKIPNNIIQKK